MTLSPTSIWYQSLRDVLNIRTKFFSHFRKAFKVFISDRYKDNLFSKNFVDKFMHTMNIMKKGSFLNFKQGNYIDGTKCRIVQLEDNKQWIDQRKLIMMR